MALSGYFTNGEIIGIAAVFAVAIYLFIKARKKKALQKKGLPGLQVPKPGQVQKNSPEHVRQVIGSNPVQQQQPVQPLQNQLQVQDKLDTELNRLGEVFGSQSSYKQKQVDYLMAERERIQELAKALKRQHEKVLKQNEQLQIYMQQVEGQLRAIVG